MAWICYNCGTKNKNKDTQCTKCGGVLAAAPKFYPHWMIGGAVVFFALITLGIYLGGALGGATYTSTSGLGTVLGLGLSLILVILGGYILGFASYGRTILESGIGFAVAVVPAIVVSRMFSSATRQEIWIVVAWAVLGLLLSCAGAWMGETIQDRADRKA